MRRIDSGAVSEPANLLECACQPRWIACELHRGGVCQNLALTANSSLDQSSEEYASPADNNKGQPKQGQGILASCCPDEYSTDNRQTKNSKNQAHETQIDSHVTIENVTELMADHSLQFVAGKHFHTATRHADGCIACRMPGRKRVDPSFAIHDVNLWDGDAGSDRHFFHNVQQLALIGVARVGIN